MLDRCWGMSMCTVVVLRVVCEKGEGSMLAYLCNGSITKSSAQEGNVSGLIVGDLPEVGIEGGIESSFGKVRLGIVLETITVELVLEVLKREGIVQDTDWISCQQGSCRMARKYGPSVTAAAA